MTTSPCLPTTTVAITTSLYPVFLSSEGRTQNALLANHHHHHHQPSLLHPYPIYPLAATQAPPCRHVRFPPRLILQHHLNNVTRNLPPTFLAQRLGVSNWINKDAFRKLHTKLLPKPYTHSRISSYQIPVPRDARHLFPSARPVCIQTLRIR